jgi:hypothetical protein
MSQIRNEALNKSALGQLEAPLVSREPIEDLS